MRFPDYKQLVSLVIVGCWLFIALASCTRQPNYPAVPNFQQTAIFQQRIPEGTAVHLWPIQANEPQKTITLTLNERYELSPGGLHLAVYFDGNIYIIDLVTFEEVILADSVILPLWFIGNIQHTFLSWSPDGSKLAVLTGGPSWQDESILSTTAIIFDIEQQSPDFMFNNNTWINEVAWSIDSTLVSFPEMGVPCFYTESCHQDEEEANWSLTTLAHSGDNVWAFLSSTKPDSINESSPWGNSICKLIIPPTNEFVVYETPCLLGYIPFDTNRFIASIQPFQPNLPVLSNQRQSDERYLTVRWLGKTNRFLLALRESRFGVERRTDSVLELYRKDETAITLLHEIDLEGHNFAFPLSLSISPDNQYIIQGLEDNHVLLMQLSDLTTTFLEIPAISLNGLWLPEGYLTQSEDEIIFIYSETGEWEVVRDNLPEEFVLVGWQVLEK